MRPSAPGVRRTTSRGTGTLSPYRRRWAEPQLPGRLAPAHTKGWSAHRSTDHPCVVKAPTTGSTPANDLWLTELARSDVDPASACLVTASYDSDTVPEYLAPGVFVEEVSYRSKAIDGVATTGVVLGIFLGLFAALAVDRACRRRRFPPS